MMEFRQDTYFEVYGRFMFPEFGIEYSTPGKIIYKKDGRFNAITLEIYGSLETNDFDRSYLEGRYNLHNIVGYTNGGMAVLIEGAKLCNGYHPGEEFSYLEYNLRNCLFLNLNSEVFDTILKDLSDQGIYNLKVSSCQYSFAGIDEWIDETEVEYAEIDKKYKYEVNVENINENIYLVKDENLKFTSGIEIKIGSSGFNEEFYWGLESIDGQDLSIKSTMNNLKMVKELLETLIMVPIDFSYLKFLVPIEEMDNKLVTGYLVSFGINTGKYRRINTDIPYVKIKENFENILCNWYKKRNKLTLITQNFIINKYAHQYNQSVLLNSIKSLEMYHRNFIQEKETEKNENLEIYKNILLNFIENNIENEDHKDRFIENVNYNPEISLKKRIKALFDDLDNDIKNILVKNKKGATRRNIDKLAQKLANTRNYYTHGDPDTDRSFIIKEPIEIIETTILLNQIIKYYICKELFVPDEEIIEIITMGMNGVIK